jgi:hypothetical protein
LPWETLEREDGKRIDRDVPELRGGIVRGHVCFRTRAPAGRGDRTHSLGWTRSGAPGGGDQAKRGRLKARISGARSGSG